jgi:hypothetical protein
MQESADYHQAVTPVKPRIPPLLCPHCGRIDVPMLGPGTQTHAARALCSNPACRRFLKWLPRALFAKENACMGGVARCIVVGCIGRAGVTVHYATSGAPCASFTLVVSEQGSDGKTQEERAVGLGRCGV